MMRRVAWALALIFSAAAMACGGESGAEAMAAGSSEFCRTALARVDSFMATASQPAGERYGGTAVVGAYGEIPDGMNAFVSSDYNASQHQAFVNLMTLVQYDEELEPVPYLAETWEVSEDGRELTFHLRDDVFWHDGERTTAHDVAFTYTRVTDPETGFPNAPFWTHYVRGPEGVEVVDSLTVRFRLEPHAEFMDPWRTTAILPEHLLGHVPPAELGQHPFGTRCPVGNGPFRFVEHRQDESWTFARNPHFPEGLGGPPFLERYVYRVILEQTTLLTELLTGNVDVYIAPGPDQADEIERSEDVRLLHYPFRTYVFVAWNARRPQLADPAVRRAITLATNRREMVDALLAGFGEVLNTGVLPYHFAYDRGFTDSLAYDPERARALLDEAGWRDRDGDGVRESEEGVPLAITLEYNRGNEQRADVAEIMQAQLADVGIRVRPRVVEYATLLEQLNDPDTRDFDGVVMAWVNDFKLDETALFHSESFDEPYAWSGTRNPTMDRFLDTLQLVTDRAEALPLWLEYQEEVVREQPYTFLFYQQRLDGVANRLRGVTMDVRGEWISIADWWIPEDQRRYGGRVAAR